MNKLEQFQEKMKAVGVPMHLHNNVYWRSMLYIVLNGPFSEDVLQFINFGQEEVNARGVKDRGWSSGQQFLITLALHLYSDTNPLPPDGLSGMQQLDVNNRIVAMQAIVYRFGG